MAAAAFFARRVRELRRDFTWREASGSMGDLGTFVPFLVGLSTRAGLDVGTTLFFTGAYNLATAIAFDVPMPVQPMKAIAAVALADDAVRVLEPPPRARSSPSSSSPSPRRGSSTDSTT